MNRYGIVVLKLAAVALLAATAGCESTATRNEPVAAKKVDSGMSGTTNVAQRQWDESTPKAYSAAPKVMTDPCAVEGGAGPAVRELQREGRQGGPCEPTATPAPTPTAARAADTEPNQLTMGGMCAGQSADLPQASNAGACFTKVWNEPKYTTVPQRTLVKPASERVEVIPARYEKVQEAVVVKAAHKEYRTIPAEYETVTEKVLVRPAYIRTETVPAVYDIIEEKELVKPAYKTWKKGTMTNIQRVDPESGEILCLVDVPAEYKTVTKRVPRSQEQTKNIQVPAEYADVKKTVLKTPERVEESEVPAVTEMREVDKLVEQGKQVKVPIEAEYADVPTQQLAEKGCYAWRQILCDNNMTQDTITKLQTTLSKKGYYQHKPSGKFDDNTLAAVNAYERDNNLPTDPYLNIETAKSLGLDVN
jgi:putative peptidoglycan binding protein